MKLLETILLIIFGVGIVLTFLVIRNEASKAQQVQRSSPIPFTTEEIDESQVFVTVNNWRKTEGLNPYNFSAQLCAFAGIRLNEIKTNFSHDGFKIGTSMIQKATGYKNSAENLSMGISNSDELLKRWLNSASHSAVLHSPYTDSCIRCSENYCIQLFGSM